MGTAICDESGSTREVTDLVFEVLNFVKVRGPVEGAVLFAAAALELDGIAEAFPNAREVPGAAIVPAVAVTRGAGHVVFQAEPVVKGVVEELFAEKDLRRQSFCRSGVQGVGGSRSFGSMLHEGGNIVKGHGTAHEVVNEESVSVSGESETLGSALHVDAEEFLFSVDVDDGDFAGAF